MSETTTTEEALNEETAETVSEATAEATATAEPAGEPAAQAPEADQAAESAAESAEPAPAESAPAEPVAAEAVPVAAEAEATPAATEPASDAKADGAAVQDAATSSEQAPAADTATPDAEAKPAAAEATETPKPESSDAPAAPAAPAAEEQTAEDKPAAAEAAQVTKEGEATKDEVAKTEEPKEVDPRAKALLAAMESKTPLSGKVFGWNQGGFHVLVEGIPCFCPRSEMEIGNPRSPKLYINQTYHFHVIEYRKKGDRFVLSRTELLKKKRAKQASELREKLAVDAEFDGVVTSLVPYGAFVDIGGMEGMVHVSEIAHRTVREPKDVLKVGAPVKVKVIKIEKGGKRLSLSIRALQPDPLREFSEKHPRGSKFSGKITSKTDFGLFVEVEPGMEGLVHVSELPPGAKLSDESFVEGAEIEGWIKEVDSKRRRISLALKEIPDHDPWHNIRERYEEGSVVEGTIEDLAKFGVFIRLEPGLTGLMPSSELGLPRGTNPGRVYTPGKQMTVTITRLEPKRRRITLAPEGATVGGTRNDYQEFVKRSSEESSTGLGAMAAAFAKLKSDD